MAMSEPVFPQSNLVSIENEGSVNANMGSVLAFLTYTYNENIFAELDALAVSGRILDGLIINLMQVGFSLPTEDFAKISLYADKVLKLHGVLLLIKADGAITLIKDEPGRGLIYNCYASSFDIFSRHPLLAEYVCATIIGIDRRRFRGGASTLANHILFTSIPVLTELGKLEKEKFLQPARKQWVLQLVDDYSSIELIARKLESNHQIPTDEALRIIQELESDNFIYPIFSRIRFISDCYHKGKAFRLGRYMVAAGIISESQLEELLEKQQEVGWGRGQKAFLGLLAVHAGYINTRELEVLLADQYLYGGYQKLTYSENPTGPKMLDVETIKDSMIGSLGAIDTAGLLQSFATAKKTGVLSIENRGKAVLIAFNSGKPTHARLKQLVGQDAVVELLVSWQEGIFVFRDKVAADDFDDNCQLSASLDRMLLDAALAQDQVNQILSQLPSGHNAILERAPNFDPAWTQLAPTALKYMDDTPVKDKEKAMIVKLAQLLDGLSTLGEAMNAIENFPGHVVVKAAQLLLDLKLVSLQQTSLFGPISVFEKIIVELKKVISADDNKALLKASLHHVHGSSPAASRFHVDDDGQIRVNLSAVKKSGVPVSQVILDLRRWIEAYLAYSRRMVGPEAVDNIVNLVMGKNKIESK
jgi:hypothetical protein